MPALTDLHEGSRRGAWLLVLYNLTKQNQAQKSPQEAASSPVHFVGSQACAKCHSEIYERWKKTPMANVVRDPREHPDAIIPDLKTNHVEPFAKQQVALV